LKPKLRSRARAAALQVLFELEFGAAEETARADVLGHFGTPPLDHGYLDRLLSGVRTRADEVDAILVVASPKWRQQRQAVIDRNVLRLAALELLENAAPKAVVLSEALQLAERYGGEQSATFVRGVLDRLIRGLKEA
jgi:N utilization substance protein B